jgi:hypothetical protein
MNFDEQMNIFNYTYLNKTFCLLFRSFGVDVVPRVSLIFQETFDIWHRTIPASSDMYYATLNLKYEVSLQELLHLTL